MPSVAGAGAPKIGEEHTTERTIGPPVAQAVRDALLMWYGSQARDLPWRRTKDPYSIWVSEIMLQQTRVDTVIPYYQRFMERFPSAHSLAQASEDEVLSYWSGLGYYRRARLLHAGVKDVVGIYGGQVPQDVDQRGKLPGIGRYTSGAIGSIAFGQQVALVDGNVARVFARLFGVDTPLGKAETEKRLWAIAEQLVVGPSPGDFNQSLMELGALVCTPKQPQCDRCPVREHCQARLEGRVAELPVPKARTAPKPVEGEAVVFVRKRDGQIWLQRGGEALFGGLWGVPVRMKDTGFQPSTLEEALRAKSSEPVFLGEVRHVLSHRKMKLRVLRSELTGRSPRKSSNGDWFHANDLKAVGVSSLTHKILKRALGDDLLG